MMELDKDKWFSQLPLLRNVHQEEIDIRLPFEQIAANFARESGTVLLLSGSDMDCSRYNLLAADPLFEIRSFQQKVTIASQDGEVGFETDIFEFLRSLTDYFSTTDNRFDLPVGCGLFGYLAYDLKDRIENLPRTCVGTGLPDLYMIIPKVILVEDKIAKKTWLSVPQFLTRDEKIPFPTLSQVKEEFTAKLDQPFENKEFAVGADGFRSSFTKLEYIDAVNRIIRYLKAGDIYQANFSQRFEAAFSGDSYALFLDLFERNPASFFSYINAGDHAIVSTSPERFVKQTGRKVETRPIKGTIARHQDPEKDRENSVKLRTSIKDDAELTMIVDLMRNDLSRVTKHDSVVVTEHKRLEPYENVYHLVSIVEGELLQNKSSVDLIAATFPGGSITGCPKIRSMEIIDELEPVKRHVYTGSIGYISFHETMDLSIAIRTATLVNDKVYFSVGGGIVYDSDPYKEYQETLDKGKTLMDALSGRKGEVEKFNAKAWVNGKICNKDRLTVSVLSEGFQYGAGVFETVKVSNGKIFFLEAHVSRMNQTWKSIFGQDAPDVTWEDVIRQLIRENGYAENELAVKLILSKNEPGMRQPFMAAFARPYVHRLDSLGKDGLDIVIYPHKRHSILADHKTMNYLFYHNAAAFAAANNANEALILNADGTVSETNTANLFAIDGKKLIVPKSLHRLSGITMEKTLAHMKKIGFNICERPVQAEDIEGLPNIILTNSLMGAVRGLRVNGRKIEHDGKDYCAMINQYLFEQ